MSARTPEHPNFVDLDSREFVFRLHINRPLPTHVVSHALAFSLNPEQYSFHSVFARMGKTLRQAEHITGVQEDGGKPFDLYVVGDNSIRDREFLVFSGTTNTVDGDSINLKAVEERADSIFRNRPLTQKITDRLTEIALDKKVQLGLALASLPVIIWAGNEVRKWHYRRSLDND